MNNSPSLINKNVNDSSNESTNYIKTIAKNILSVKSIAQNMNTIVKNFHEYVQLKKNNITEKKQHFLKIQQLKKDITVKKQTEKLKPKQLKKESKSNLKGFLLSISLFIILKNFEEVKEKVQEIYQNFKQIQENLFQDLQEKIEEIQLNFQQFKENVFGEIEQQWEDIKGSWNDLIKDVDIWKGVTSVLGDIVQFFSFGLFSKDDVQNFLGENTGIFFDNVKKFINEFIEKVVNWFSEKFNTIRESICPKTTKLKEIEKLKKQEIELFSKKEITEKTKQIESQQADLKKQKTDYDKKLQKEKIYTDEDRIVRQRTELPPKTKTITQEETEKPTRTRRIYFQKESAAITAGRQYKSSIPTPTGDDRWIMNMIKQHEGVRNVPYKDSRGLWTVGVGHLIGDGRSLPPEYNRQFSSSEIDFMFAKDYEEHKKMAEKAPGYDLANEKGKAALIDLTFNMGGGWFKKFKNAAAALAQGNFELAAEELTDSLWYKQVKGRAVTIVNMIREGLGGSPSKITELPESKIASSIPSTPIQIDASPTSSTTSRQSGSLQSLASVQSGVDISGLNPEFTKRLAAMAADFKEKTGEKLTITSGFRSNEKQKQLWDAKVAQLDGNVAAARKLVAEPAAPLGHGRGSYHSKGLAIDINSKGKSGINILAGSKNSSTGWLESFGLSRPVQGEDWHIQPTGLTPTPDNPLNPGAPIQVAGKNNKAVNLATGEKESISSLYGTQIAATSTEIASDYRKQQKPCTPMIINAPVNNTQLVTNKKSTISDKKIDIVDLLLMRIA